MLAGSCPARAAVGHRGPTSGPLQHGCQLAQALPVATPPQAPCPEPHQPSTQTAILPSPSSPAGGCPQYTASPSPPGLCPPGPHLWQGGCGKACRPDLLEGWEGSSLRLDLLEGREGSSLRPDLLEGWEGSSLRPDLLEGWEGISLRPDLLEGWEGSSLCPDLLGGWEGSSLVSVQTPPLLPAAGAGPGPRLPFSAGPGHAPGSSALSRAQQPVGRGRPPVRWAGSVLGGVHPCVSQHLHLGALEVVSPASALGLPLPAVEAGLGRRLPSSPGPGLSLGLSVQSQV